MSGIQLPASMTSRSLSKDETPEDRYPSFKQVSERYSIIQLGICLFENISESSQKAKFHVVRLLDNNGGISFSFVSSWMLEMHYLILSLIPSFQRRYKFTLFPPSDASREIVLSPGSVKFLSEDNNWYVYYNSQRLSGFCFWSTSTY